MALSAVTIFCDLKHKSSLLSEPTKQQRLYEVKMDQMVPLSTPFFWLDNIFNNLNSYRSFLTTSETVHYLYLYHISEQFISVDVYLLDLQQ